MKKRLCMRIFFSDFDFMDVTKRKKVKAEEYFKNRSAPTLGSVLKRDFRFNNYGIWKTLSLKLEEKARIFLSIIFYPVFTGTGLIRETDTGK